ncbi:Ribosomal protein [Chamberlinius hualienensis]
MEKIVRVIPRLQTLLMSSRIFLVSQRFISLTQVNCLKEIRESENGKAKIIEGVYVESPRKNYLVSTEKSDCCYMCKLNLDLQHTDVLILSQFVKADGTLLPEHVTGLCGMQQKIMDSLVKQAIHAGLMPCHNPTKQYQNPRHRYKHKHCNRYFTGQRIAEKAHEYV